MKLIFHISMIVFFLLIMAFFSENFFTANLLLFYLIFISLKEDFFMALALIILGAFLLNGLSAAPFGVFFFSFIWVFFIQFFLSAFLRRSSPLFFFLLALIGLLIKNLFIFLVFLFSSSLNSFQSSDLLFLFKEVSLSLLIAPLFYLIFERLYICLALSGSLNLASVLLGFKRER